MPNRTSIIAAIRMMVIGTSPYRLFRRLKRTIKRPPLVVPLAASWSRRVMVIAMRPSHGGHATRGDDITPGRAALRDFQPAYVGSGQTRNRLGAPLCQLSPAADKSSHMLWPAVCQEGRSAPQQAV